MITTISLENLSKIDQIGLAFAAEANYPGGWSLNSFSSYWSLLLSGGLGKIFVLEQGGKLVAALGAAFLNDPYSGEFTASEQFWYVLPSHRNTRAGMELFQAFQQEAVKRQAKKIVMVHLAELTPESLQKFYEREGFRLAEQTFWKEL